MKVRLALASAPVSLEERYGRFSDAASTEPSFGLASLASVAQRAGVDSIIVEASAENLSLDRALAEITAFNPDVVGITATTAGIVAAGALAKRLKDARPEAINLVGGCHVTALPEDTLLNFQGFDIAVLGEGEDTLVDILKHVQDGDRKPQSVQGTAVREGDGVRINPRRPLIEDLDSLPLPAWSLIRGFPTAFRPSPARIKRWPCASVVLTRGCPNQCIFCDRSVFGNRCRAYSSEYAVRTFKDLRENFGVREVLIEDDTFVISKKTVREFCERMITEKVDVTWSCLGRADRVDLDLLKLMKKAGCWHISYGIESGSPEILKLVRKNLDIDQIRQAVAWSREAGLRTKGFFMIGFPGETEATLRATRELALSLPVDDITVMQLTPFPGSELYGKAGEYGAFERDWRKMNTLETVFVPRGLSRSDLESARARMLREFYMRPGVIVRHMIHAAGNPRLAFAMFRGLPAFFRLVREH